MFDWFLLLLLLLILGALVYEKFFQTEKFSQLEKTKQLEEELKVKSEKISELNLKLEKTIQENNELVGKNKQLFINNTALNEQLKASYEKNNENLKNLQKYENEKDNLIKNTEKKILDLEEARKSLLDEKQRIRTEDEEKRRKKEEEVNRLWNEYEQKFLFVLKDYCQKLEYDFSFYDNNNLPEIFTGKFKPDFIIDFLDQFLIFDAKTQKPDTKNPLQNYLKEQAKSTAKKIKNSENKEQIYPIVFFVVPDLSTLKDVYFYEEGISFFVINLEVVPVILSLLKKITYYDNLENFDPQERENIIKLIANYEQQISFSNAVSILSALKGIKTCSLKEDLSLDLQNEITLQKNKIRVNSFRPNELKSLMNNPENEINTIKSLIQTKSPPIEKEDLSLGQKTLFNNK